MAAPNILVVDDEALIVSILQRFLKAAGYRVVPAVGGREAIEILQSDMKIDLMIVDLKMPDIPGTDVIDEGRKKMIPVIIMSAGIGTDKAVHYLYQLGYKFNDIFSKPVNLYKLLDEVKRKLSKSIEE